jgi:hypothetical protein
METNYLLSSKFKKLGWIILVPSVILGLITIITDWEPPFFDVRVIGMFIGRDFLGNYELVGLVENNILNEILGVLVIIGGIIVAFSKEKNEDELITKTRLESLVWAMYLNYGVLLVAFLILYDFTFFWAMVFNMFTMLFFFIIRFNVKLWRLSKSVSYEEQY